MSSPGNRDETDKIKSRLDIIDVIGHDPEIDLRHTGNGEYVGSVPPVGGSGSSLKVDQKRQVWHDMKNGKGGDVLDWIAYRNGLDARGNDFPEVLRIGAELAGVELEEMTDEERNAAKEKADIYNLFTDATEIYHSNLTSELYDHINKNWGIDRETVDKYKIGYATTDRNLKELAGEALSKSGLIYVNNGKPGGEVFRGRIIFPYWKSGKVVYLIGRETKYTLEAEREKGMKYKKLLVHKEGREYISPSVQNSYFYGEDSLRGSDYCIITEGVTDCIAMLQVGFPCISPVTVRFRDQDHPKLISLTKRLKRVYICNDNESNKAGLKGALRTAEALERAGIEARLIKLPKPEGLDKIDIAEYMKTATKEDFRGLMDSSLGLCGYLLEQQEIPAASPDRLRAFKAFISNDLGFMPNDEWKVFVTKEGAKKFKLNKTDINDAVAAAERERQNNNERVAGESEGGDEGDGEKESTGYKRPSLEERLKEYPEEIIRKANDILEHGDAFDFILKVWSTRHVGDKNIGEHLLCSIAGTMIPNTRLGLHMKPSGATGTGKSTAMEAMLDLLPESKYITGSLSSKVLFYDDSLETGTIVYTDDAKIEGDIIVTLRALTSNYQKETIHRTLNSDLEVKVRKIPPRVTIWLSAVDSIQDEQLQTRFCLGDTDESETQDERVNVNQKKRATAIYSPKKDDDILVCQCIFDMIFQNECPVYAPLIDAVEWNDKAHRRNFDKFLDMLFSVTLYNYKQRKNVYGGIVSTLEDFDRAVEIYNGTAANNACNLNGKEMKIMKCIQASPGRTITFTDLQEKTGIKETNLRYTMNGRNGGEGLLGKVKGLFKKDRTDSVGSSDGTVRTSSNSTVYRYTGNLFEVDSMLFQSVATIDREKAERLTSEFISTNNENTRNSHISHTTLTNDVRDKNDCSKDDINNNNTIITQNREEAWDSSCTIFSTDPVEKVSNNSCESCEGILCESCEDCSDLGQPTTIKNVSLDVSHCEGTLTCKLTDTESKCEPSCEPTCEPTCESGYVDSVKSDTSKINPHVNYDLTGLLKRALVKFARVEYRGTVPDIDEFIRSFNAKVPEYREALGVDAVGYNANQLHMRGWRM